MSQEEAAKLNVRATCPSPPVALKLQASSATRKPKIGPESAALLADFSVRGGPNAAERCASADPARTASAEAHWRGALRSHYDVPRL